MTDLIIISDSIPAANGGGISQTLYNLLDGWGGRLFFISRPGEKTGGPSLDVILVTHRFERYSSYSNRILKKLNARLLVANFNQQQKLKAPPAGLPAADKAIVLVSTTEPIKLQLAWLFQEKFGYTVVPYVMDDWMDGLELKWSKHDIGSVIKSLLQKAPCRLMISRELDEILTKRYQLAKMPTLVVHNPAPEAEREMTGDGWRMTDHRTIIYAGSIWAMHFDALQAVSKAVQLLTIRDKAKDGLRQTQPDKLPRDGWEKDRQELPVAEEDNSFKLIIYTSQAAWEHNRTALEGPGVYYGGFIPYSDIHKKLAKGWLLLVTASFSDAWQAFSRSSVQTKLTDYMAAGRPVLFAGPSHGASGRFVEEWDCGFTIGTSNPADIAEQLLAIARMPAPAERKALNGLAAATGYFSRPAVQQRLYDFLVMYIPGVTPFPEYKSESIQH